MQEGWDGELRMQRWERTARSVGVGSSDAVAAGLAVLGPEVGRPKQASDPMREGGCEHSGVAAMAELLRGGNVSRGDVPCL